MASDGVECEEPPCINPYEVLEVAEQASADEIKSAYRKKALKHHPGTSTEVMILILIIFGRRVLTR